jgi:hypothetical protein
MLLVGWRVLKPIPDIARASANFKSTGDPTEHAPDDISGVGV